MKEHISQNRISTGQHAGLQQFTSFASRFYAIIILFSLFTQSAYGSNPVPGNPALAGCSPYSTMPCSAVQVSLPFSLSFNAAASGTIADKTGQGTGFTTVNPYSGTRLAVDGGVKVADVPGYEPSKIMLANGRLAITANKGIDFQGNNNQINVLGARILAARKLQLDVQVINPFNGTQSEQAGLWYGLNDKTFLKLGITGNKVELRRELNDVSATVTNTTNPDQRRTPVIAGMETKTVRLRMIVDADAGTAEGFYSTDGITYLSTGEIYPVKSINIANMGITSGAVYMGIFTTYRNATSAVTFNFDQFAARELAPPANVKINFQPASATVPAGYTADTGLPFDATRKFGWVAAANKQPIDFSANTRVRTGSGDTRQLSLVQMQATSDNLTEGAWEYSVPNGRYRVTVSAGDNNYYNSIHQINVEGLPAVSDFRPTGADKFRTAIATVQVNDGKLTIDPAGGSNTKLNYVTFVPATTVSDATAPVAAARFEGTLRSAGVYDQQVRVSLSATDGGAAGLTSLKYALNGGVFTDYTVPFIISTAGSYSLVVKAADANNNESTTSAYNFTIYKQPAVQPVYINFQPASAAVPAGYIADTGMPFDATRKFGWVNAATKQPSNYSGNTRVRTGTGDARQLSFIQIQAPADNMAEGAWEYVVPNGTYTVTASAGDNNYYDSNHQVNVEGLPAISDFTPASTSKFRTATATVQVTDGKLTISPTGGTNTKLNYLTFAPAATISDATAPTAKARFAGTLKSANVYDQQVKIYLSAIDQGASGLTTLQYAINGGVFNNYTAPLTLNAAGSYSLVVKATDANNNEVITSPYTFSIFTSPPVEKSLSFSKVNLSFTTPRGKSVISQSVTLTGSPATTSFILAKSDASWLTLPGTASTTLNFGPANISPNLEPGDYFAQVTASSEGYTPAVLTVELHIVAPPALPLSRINFQNAQTVPPLGYMRDYGQTFGLRSEANQGAGLYFGWRKRLDGTPFDLSLNGRNRGVPLDVLQATLMHMQADDITSTFSGTKVEGYWEIKVPNGAYDVTVSVGDGLVNSAPEAHSANVEGIAAVNKFVPIGKEGSVSRFTTGKVRVTVTDENLTLNADGGTNTKINYVNIVPVSVSAYVYWAVTTRNVVVKKGSTGSTVFPVVLGNSSNSSLTYNLSATYGTGATGWLQFNSTVTGTQPAVSFNYGAAKSLAVGVYKATVKATSGTLTSALIDIQINVVDETKPYVISSNPQNGAKNVSLDIPSISANNLFVPQVTGFPGGVDNSTIVASAVKLFKLVNNNASEVEGSVGGTIGGDAISFKPKGSLEPNTIYKFTVSPEVKSYPGVGFAPYEATFTTSAAVVDSSNFLNAQFTKVSVPGTQNKKYSSLVIGPDGKFYALRLDGVIERYNINHADGSLALDATINTLVTKYGNRSAIGIAFDPQSTATNLIAWVSHSSAGLKNAPAFDGNISRLSGTTLQNEQSILIKLPRSTKDHLINSITFGPDKALYMSQGAMNSAGASDNGWQREETLLSAAVLRLDLQKLTNFALPINVQTTFDPNVIKNAPATSATMSDGTYNPYGSSSPLTIYQSGVRNAYDLIWHTNGQMYMPTNGSGGAGNSPASVTGTRKVNGTFYNGPSVPATTGINAQTDWLFRANPNRPVGYFGHPNPLRGEYVLNRGYPDNPLYSPFIQPDANYRAAAYNFGVNISPNGVIEYKSNNFNNALKGKLLVCRFAGGSDIAVMEPGSMTKTGNSSDDAIYDIVKVTTGSSHNGLVGMSGFGNPLDIVEDEKNGNLYVIEFNWDDSPNIVAQIALLRALPLGSPAPAARTADSLEVVEALSAATKNALTTENTRDELYPNPVSEVLQINVPDWNNVKNVTMTNLSGQTVYSSGNIKVLAGGINVSSLPAGLYVVRVEKKDNKVSSHRIVVTK